MGANLLSLSDEEEDELLSTFFFFFPPSASCTNPGQHSFSTFLALLPPTLSSHSVRNVSR